MDAPLARHLTRFSSPQGGPAIVVAPIPEAATELTITVASHEAQLNAAAAAARAEAEAEGAAALTRADAAHAAALADAAADAEARCVARAGDAVAAQVVAALTSMQEDVARQVAQALRPLLEEALLLRAVAAVGDTVARAIADPDHPPLTARGPARILAAIEARLPASSGVSFVADEEADVVITGNGIRIEARLAEALAAIAGSEARP